MGMFDTVYCKHPLPGTPPAWAGPDYPFQTKDLDCVLAEYEITADGRLVKMPAREPVGGDQSLDFGGYHVVRRATADSPGYGESVEYLARIEAGRLTAIRETGRRREPILFRSCPPKPPTPEQITRRRERETESLQGRTVYVLLASLDRDSTPVPAEVVAESPRQWCLRRPDGVLELHDRMTRDRVVFDTAEDALRQQAYRKAAADRYKAEYDDAARRIAEEG